MWMCVCYNCVVYCCFQKWRKIGFKEKTQLNGPFILFALLFDALQWEMNLHYWLSSIQHYLEMLKWYWGFLKYDCRFYIAFGSLKRVCKRTYKTKPFSTVFFGHVRILAVMSSVQSNLSLSNLPQLASSWMFVECCFCSSTHFYDNLWFSILLWSQFPNTHYNQYAMVYIQSV